MSNLGTRHPSDEQLLHFADGEMPAPQSEDIRGHLKACWQCRNELDEIEQTISECVRYRKIVLDTCLPPPPAPWFDIYPRLARIDESQTRRRLLNRVLEPLVVWSNPRRWIPAVAMVVLIAVVVQQFRQAPSVQAAELLRKAVAAATSQPHKARRIRIRTRTQHLTRIVGNAGTAVKTKAAAESTAALESLFQAAHYSWEDPLSAKSYAEWRDQLADKRDEVTREADHYQLRTTTDSGELVEATLKLSSPDLRAVEGTLQFRNRETVEISELPDTPAPSPEASMEAAGAAASASRTYPSRSNQRGEGPSPATPGEELAVVASLHRLGADLGDPVEVTRSGGAVLVTGTGIGIERQQEIREQLRAMPHVTVRLSSEPSAESPGLEERSPSRISVGPGTGPLQAEMEERLGGRAAFEQFADGVFELADTFMSRAHALRRLAQRFPPDIEAQMTSQQRQLLERLRQDHAEALLGNVRELEGRIHSALGMALDDAQQVDPPGQWQDKTEQLFVEARYAETMLVALLGGSPEEIQSPELPARVAASVSQLLKRAENYLRLTTGR
jgi:hypothetical protein